MKEISYKDIEALIDELNKAGDDKTRVIDDVSNKKVKEILYQELETIDKSGIPISKLCCVGGVLGIEGLTIGAGGVATGGVVTAGSAIGVGGVATGIGSLALSEGGAVVGGLSAAAFADRKNDGTGGSAGSNAEKIIYAAVGAAIGFAIGNWGRIKEKKKRIKAEKYMQATMKKEMYWRDLEQEFNELKGKFKTMKEQNERLRYIISIFMAKEDLDNIL